jgi:hypothetical protein
MNNQISKQKNEANNQMSKKGMVQCYQSYDCDILLLEIEFLNGIFS